jgi:ReqiPepy6 Gp37-like protein
MAELKPRVLVRNDDLEIIGEVEDFTGLRVTTTHNEVGTWDLVLSGESPAVDLLDPATNPGGGIIVRRGGQTVLSGPVGAFGVSGTEEGRDVVTVSGTDDMIWLASRLVYPDPAHTADAQTAPFYVPTTAPAETVMRDLVNKNLGSGAIVSRRLADLTLEASAGRGKSSSFGRYRFDRLIDVLQAISNGSKPTLDPYGDVGFRLDQVGTGLLYRAVATGDTTGTIRFSRNLGTLRTYSHTSTAPTLTDLVLGAGLEALSGTDNLLRIAAGIFTYQRTDTLWPRRMEGFTDVGALNPDDFDTGPELAELQEQLDQQAQTAYDTGAGQVGVTITPRETEQQRYGEHFNVGDYCTVILPRLTFVERIREVTLTYDAQAGEQIAVSIGTADGPYQRRTPGVYRRLADLRRYLDYLKKAR